MDNLFTNKDKAKPFIKQYVYVLRATRQTARVKGLRDGKDFSTLGYLCETFNLMYDSGRWLDDRTFTFDQKTEQKVKGLPMYMVNYIGLNRQFIDFIYDLEQKQKKSFKEIAQILATFLN